MATGCRPCGCASRWRPGSSPTPLARFARSSRSPRLPLPCRRRPSRLECRFSGARSAYEHATSQAALKALPATLADTQAAVGEYAAAARVVDHLDVLGQVGARLRPGDTSLSAAAAALDKGQLSDARAAIATAQTTHQDQERTGLYAVLGAAALLLAGLAGSAWLLLRRRRRARPIAS